MKSKASRILNPYKYSVTITLIACFGGALSFMIFKGDLSLSIDSIHDKDFRDKCILFIVSTLTVIFGIEYFQQKQKDELFLDNLKVIGFGYNIHFVLANAYNCLLDLKSVENNEPIPAIYHTYFKTTKDQTREQEIDNVYTTQLKKLILKIDTIDIIEDNLDSYIDDVFITKYSEIFGQLLTEITNKLSFAINNESEHIILIFKLIEGLKKALWELKKLSDKDNEKTLIRKKRLIMGALVMIDVCYLFYKNHQQIFFKSEYEYEKVLLRKSTLMKWSKIQL